MTISTVDQLVGGLLQPRNFFKTTFTGQAAGQFHSFVYIAGLPGAATAPSPGLAGEALTSYSGQIVFPNAIGGESIYLAGLDLTQGGNIGGAMLADRLFQNSGIVSATTTAQTVNSVAFPARDNLQTTSGSGVNIALEVSTATTNGSPITNTTMSYTNSASVSGRTGTITSFPANAVVGTFVPFSLQAGDTGVKSIQSITLGTSYGTGVVNMVAYRPIGFISTPTSSVTGAQDFAQLGMPLMYDSSVPFLVYSLTGTAGGSTIGTINYAQG